MHSCQPGFPVWLEVSSLWYTIICGRQVYNDIADFHTEQIWIRENGTLIYITQDLIRGTSYYEIDYEGVV